MAAINTFIEDCDPHSWSSSLQLYNKVLKEKAKQKTKPAASKELIDLDEWYQQEFPEVVKNRDVKSITSTELVKLMKWKLSRGKFRPRLVELAGSNSAEEVKKCSTEAFKKCDKGNLRGAIEALSKLKGIGPATASAVLATGCPDKAAFMADEPTVALLGPGSLKYNLAEYLSYMDGIQDCVRCLNENMSSAEASWTAHQAELALWTHILGLKLTPELLTSSKRKGETSAEGDKVVSKKKSKT